MAGVDRPRVLLVWPTGPKSIDIVPLFMAFLVPQLLKVAHVVTMDCVLLGITPDVPLLTDIARYIKPDLIGISAWSFGWQAANLSAQVLRSALPYAPIVMGGPHASVTGETGYADFALAGEGEVTFPQLVGLLAQQVSEDELTKVPGLRFDGQKIVTPAEPIDDLDGLGLPRYASMSLYVYNELGYSYRNYDEKQAPILATRGCPYGCKFCSASMISGRKIRKHSISYLRELLLYLKRDFEITHINIVDDNFTFYPDYVKQFCEMVLQNRDRLGNMTFATPNGIRVERSDAEMFRMMRSAGWSNVIFAPESGSQRIVNLMGKHLDLDIVSGRVDLAHAAGLEVEAFFIMNYPGETAEDRELTQQFVKRVPFDELSLHAFIPLPHTEAWRELVEAGEIDRNHAVTRYNEVNWVANGRTAGDVGNDGKVLIDIVNRRKGRIA